MIRKEVIYDDAALSCRNLYISLLDHGPTLPSPIEKVHVIGAGVQRFDFDYRAAVFAFVAFAQTFNFAATERTNLA
jgi:hypothetical protein